MTSYNDDEEDGLDASSAAAEADDYYARRGLVGGEEVVYESAMRRSSFSEAPLDRRARRRNRKERILKRRGAFDWLPVAFSNDLVHGAWWFVLGSFIAMIIPIVPLVDLFEPFWPTSSSGSVPLLEDAYTFGLLIVSGLFFTLGSLAFVRATEDPPIRPLFNFSVHVATDELLAAWFFLLGTIPFVPFMAVYVYYNPSYILYWGCLIASVIFNIATYFFVLSCYPSEEREQSVIIANLFRSLCCNEKSWIHRHISNDWLAGCWIFYYATLLLVIGSAVMLYIAVKDNNHLEVFDWVTSTIDAIIFLIGSAYFCAGSYPQGDGGGHHIAYGHNSSYHYQSYQNDQKGMFEADPLISSQRRLHYNKDKSVAI